MSYTPSRVIITPELAVMRGVVVFVNGNSNPFKVISLNGKSAYFRCIESLTGSWLKSPMVIVSEQDLVKLENDLFLYSENTYVAPDLYERVALTTDGRVCIKSCQNISGFIKLVSVTDLQPYKVPVLAYTVAVKWANEKITQFVTEKGEVSVGDKLYVYSTDKVGTVVELDTKVYNPTLSRLKAIKLSGVEIK